MNGGFFGKVLWIDLFSEIFEEEILNEEIYKQYIGGYGLGSYLLYKHMKPRVDPLGMDSILGFFPGLMTGTPAPFSGRYMVVGKSPLTKTWANPNSGGSFGPEIKKCGYDGILIKGIASTPKYISIIEGKKEILDASDIWKLDIVRAEERLKEKHGKFIKTAGIGQAGVNLSLIAGVANDKGRIAARQGLGAVMGSKNLKMLVLKGNEKMPYHNKDHFLDVIKEHNREHAFKEPRTITKQVLQLVPRLGKFMRRTGMGFSVPPGIKKQVWRNLGTSSGNTLCAEIGDSPVKNWSGIGMVDFPYSKSKNISALELQKYKIRDYGCFSCPVQCGAILKVPELDLEETHLPEYETCCAFGTLLLNDDLKSIIEINDICNRAAIDTISLGGTVAFAIECYENGILTKVDTDGLDLTWGNSGAIVALTKKIINREGIGEILADGSKIASEKIGNGSDQYVMASLGCEFGMHDPKKYDSLAFSYAYDPTPGNHNAASIDLMETLGPMEKFIKGTSMPKGWKKNLNSKYKAQVINTSSTQVINSLGLCILAPLFGEYPFFELFNSLTGWDYEFNNFFEIGLRIQNLRQAFTLREGVKLAENELPGRVIGNPPNDIGPNKNITVEYKDFYQGYCKEMGWNEKGFPLPNTLLDLDLEFVIDDLYRDDKDKKNIYKEIESISGVSS
ncbi:MAG: aldehyde ferredoxin oxidoreductase family protein [Promethearchaeota archaeon]